MEKPAMTQTTDTMADIGNGFQSYWQLQNKYMSSELPLNQREWQYMIMLLALLCTRDFV